MPRAPRIELAGGIHHVASRAPSRRDFFETIADRNCYLALLAKEIQKRGWHLFTYCQMTNHVHLLLQTPAPDLGAGLKCVHQAFAELVNHHRDEHGAVFGARFASRLVRDDSHFKGCLRYIARNPVEAGMVRSPEEWIWSAHGALAGLRAAPAFLDVHGTFGQLHEDPRAARKIYAEVTGWSTRSLLGTLSSANVGDAWMPIAVDDYAVGVADIADFLALSCSRVRHRLAGARQAAAL